MMIVRRMPGLISTIEPMWFCAIQSSRRTISRSRRSSDLRRVMRRVAPLEVAQPQDDERHGDDQAEQAPEDGSRQAQKALESERPIQSPSRQAEGWLRPRSSEASASRQT